MHSLVSNQLSTQKLQEAKSFLGRMGEVYCRFNATPQEMNRFEGILFEKGVFTNPFKKSGDIQNSLYSYYPRAFAGS